MASLNKVILLGNLTRDPEMRYTPNGTAVSSFGLAVNRRFRQGDEWRDEVCYVDIVTFGRQAETVGEYLSKGNLAMIEGRLQWRSWETEDGQKRSKHEVIANNIQFMPRGQSEGMGRQGQGSGSYASGASAASGPPSSSRPPSSSGSSYSSGSSGYASPGDMGDMPMPSDDDIPF